MSITMVNASNFDDGQDAVGSECVAEWQNIIDNALNLVSPWTGNMSAGGYKLTTLALGALGAASISPTGNTATGIYFGTANSVDVSCNGSLVADFSPATVTIAPGTSLALTSPTITLTAGAAVSQFTATYTDIGSTIRVANGASTGVAAKSIVLDNAASLQWINQAQTTTANHYIQVAASDNMQFCVPDLAGQRYYFLWGADALFGLTQEQDGAGILFNSLSSTDHSAPGTGCVIYTVVNAGKIELRALFPSGAAQLLAAEP